MEAVEIKPEDVDALTPEQRAELADRLEKEHYARGKASFKSFCEMVDVPGTPITTEEAGLFYASKLVPASHHRLVIEAVQRFADGRYGDVDGIMVFMPPGSAKSTYGSVLAPSWLMGRKPGTNVIAASYGQDLANRFGRRVRQIVRGDEFARIMGCTITGDNQAVDSWSITNGSDYRAAGMGAAITGFRADWLIIDDPIKGREEADSETIREKIYQGYVDDLDSRLKPGGKTIFILTRWHEDDPAGRILGEDWKGQSGMWKGTDGKRWLIINLPLLAEHKDDPLGRAPGELLWPEWFRLEDAQRRQEQAKKGGTFARSWASLYQQRPAPNEGAILSRDYWRAWEKVELPEVERVFLCYDTAFEEDEEADFSAMSAWGVFKWISKKTSGEEYNHHHVILLGGWQDKVSAVDLIDRVIGDCKLFKPDRLIVEKRASGIQLCQELKRRRLPVKEWLPKGKPGTKGKIPRAHAVASILEQGSCWYVPGRVTDKILDQCAAFPYGVHDDWCDTVTMALAFFRDKWIFQTRDDELSEEELKDILSEKAENRKPIRRLYGSNEAKKFGKHDLDVDDIQRMTPETRRRLYGANR